MCAEDFNLPTELSDVNLNCFYLVCSGAVPLGIQIYLPATGFIMSRINTESFQEHKNKKPYSWKHFIIPKRINRKRMLAIILKNSGTWF